MTPVRDIVYLEHFTPQNAKTQLRDHSCTISQKANYSIVNLRNKWMRTYSCAGPHPQRNRISQKLLLAGLTEIILPERDRS